MIKNRNKLLKNKVIVITGAAGLVGKEFVKAVVKQKGIAVIADIDANLGKKLKKHQLYQKYTGLKWKKSMLHGRR